MSELKALLADARSSLHDWDDLLQRARSLDRGQQAVGQESLQWCIDELLGVIKRIPKDLLHEERVRRETEIQQLHREMEEVRHRVEASIERIEAACELSVAQLSEFIESLQERLPGMSQERQPLPQAAPLNDLLAQGRQSLANKDYQTCLTIMNKVLHSAPENLEAIGCVEDARRKLEDQRLEEELVIHLDNLKKEATDLFDLEKYRECAELFKFLCELEPKNRTLQDYLELSLEKAREIEEQSTQSTHELESQEAEASKETPKTINTTRQAVLGSEARTNVAHAETEPLSPRAQAGFKDETQEDLERTHPTPALGVAFGAVSLLVLILVGALLLRGVKVSPTGSLNLNTEPSGVSVLVDGQPRGETPLRLETLEVGKHTLSLTKQGYVPASQLFTILSGQPSSISVQLQPQSAAPAETDPGQVEAVALFDRGLWLEASRVCDSLLAKDPQNRVAAGLKNKIREHYWEESELAQRRGKTPDARVALQNLLLVSPEDGAALGALKSLQANPKGRIPSVAGESSLLAKADELRSKIAAAMSSANYFPPAAGNALELIQRLGAMSPADPVFKEQMDQIHREAITQVQRKIQSKDVEGARALARQLQEYFPASSELKALRESIKVEDPGAVEILNGLMQRIDSAMAHGNYVTPASDNAMLYCNRVLALDSQNAKALTLRHEISARASAQAKDLVSNEKFDEALGVFSALLTAVQNEGKTAAMQEIRKQIDKLEFASYPVTHDHALGSCAGRLRFNAYVIAYVPSGGSKDGFSQKVTDILNTESADKIKIQFKNKTYRFQPNPTNNKEESRQKVEEIQTRLSKLVGEK